MSPPISLRRIDRYDGHRVTYHYRSHKSERVERETVEVYTFIGRMVQHVFPKGFQRIRYYGVQATKTFAKLKGLIQEALAKVKGIVKGAIKIIAPLTYRQRYQQSTGRDPLRCPHCHSDMGVWRIWHPTYGVIHDELEAIRRGKYASQAPRAAPTRKPWTNPLARRRRNISIAARSAVKRCWSMKPSLMWPSVRPNFAGNIPAGCPRLGVPDATARLWSTLSKSPSAESSDLFWHDQMRLSLTTIVGINTGFEFVRTQQPVRFRHGPLAMDPFWLNRVEPRTFAGQVAAHETHPDCAALDPLIMLA